VTGTILTNPPREEDLPIYHTVNFIVDVGESAKLIKKLGFLSDTR
jgi:hypothetical protein